MLQKKKKEEEEEIMIHSTMKGDFLTQIFLLHITRWVKIQLEVCYGYLCALVRRQAISF